MFMWELNLGCATTLCYAMDVIHDWGLSKGCIMGLDDGHEW